MVVPRHQIIHENFLRFVENLKRQPPNVAVTAPEFLSRGMAWEIFESQVKSRRLDLEARAMKSKNAGYYTIGSSGHEGNAALAAALRPDDPCFLHYRSGAFMMQRARQVPGQTPIFDTLLSLAASAEDPASGGRHKVWGSLPLWVPPQTSTIASHLPKAVGAAFAIERARALDHSLPVSKDAIAVCTFGDASLNHSTAVGALNAALWAAFQNVPAPVLFVCEDNSIGISVRTPEGWVASQYSSRPCLAYFSGNGLSLSDAVSASFAAVEHCRTRRVPTFLHLKTVRLMGHAGSDVESTYRTLEEIAAVEEKDPLLVSAAELVTLGFATPDEILECYETTGRAVSAASMEASRRRKITSVAEVLEPLAPWDSERVALEAARQVPPQERIRVFGGEGQLPESGGRPRHMAMLINWALHDLMIKYPEMLLFGEDVAKKGGVYHITNQLCERFGVGRVFNTLLDEQTILGLAMGAAHLGFLPCPEIQYLAYLVHAADQLRGEACSLQFFSNRQFANPMVVRVAGLAYQKGFGGHFHNDNGFGFLREIPGLIVAAPSRGDDAVRMLRTLFAAGKAEGRVSLFLEPIALYMTKDLHETNDNGWLNEYPGEGEFIPLGEPRIYDTENANLTIITYANGTWMSLRAAKRLYAAGIRARVIDLRWLAPLNVSLLEAEARRSKHILVVDEGRTSGGIGEQITSVLVLSHPANPPKIGRVSGQDCYVPLAAAANLVLISEDDIETGARRLMSEDES